jgi:hypothetical protein
MCAKSIAALALQQDTCNGWHPQQLGRELKPHQRICGILFDKSIISAQMEYSGGALQGFARSDGYRDEIRGPYDVRIAAGMLPQRLQRLQSKCNSRLVTHQASVSDGGQKHIQNRV